MLGFRINPPGPFWFEDFVFFAIDETRRLPGRIAKLSADTRRRASELTARLLQAEPARHQLASQPVAARIISEPARLEEAEAWELATDPVAAVGTGMASAVALHEAAREQLDAVTYVLDRIRDEVRPLMTYTRLAGDEVHQLPTQADLDTSIEALLALSRLNAATRPKSRVLSAA